MSTRPHWEQEKFSMQVYSSLSGIPFYAPSAGYAPTNSADVSAIASAYQVVSSTATQLYAGTAYVTSINETPVSAARAGNAANASLANSAWYDGTGRIISSLPDSATVSAIASSYVESGVSSKQDTLSFAYNTADQISSINGSALGGMDDNAVSAIASAYAESAASGKQDELTFSYDDDKISAINGSAIAGGGGGVDSATVSAIASSYAESAVSSYQPLSGMSGYASAFSAGEGLEFVQSGDDQVLQVEAPVDIVAGPGIVIDNPDGNTLRVSTEADAETVLYDAGDSPSQSGPWNISEARTNFEWIDVVFGNDSADSMKQVTRFASDSSYMKLNLPRYDEEPSYKWATMTLSWNNTTASIKSNSVGRFTIASNGSVSVSTAAAQAPYLFQIIGVHRISGGN